MSTDLLTWHDLGDGMIRAQGRHWTYLITTTQDPGLTVRLTRYTEACTARVAAQAAAHSIELGGAPEGYGPDEVTAYARDIARAYEYGQRSQFHGRWPRISVRRGPDMSTDPHHDALMAIARSLTPDETAVILTRLAPPGSAMHGAEVADLLDMLDQHDAHLDKIEPFYDDHEHELPQVAGTRYALYALIALDAALTVENLTRMLTAAGLMPKPVTEAERGYDLDELPHPELGPGSGHQPDGPADCPRCQMLRDNQGWMEHGLEPHTHSHAGEAAVLGPLAREPHIHQHQHGDLAPHRHEHRHQALPGTEDPEG